MPPSPPGSPSGYQSVKEAITELHAAQLYAREHAPAQVRLPPVWANVHAQEQRRQQQRHQVAAARRGFPRAEDSLYRGGLTQSTTSSLPAGRFGSRPATGLALTSAGKSVLNNASTFHYGEVPMKPTLCLRNQYNAIGNNSMFGSQVRGPLLAGLPLPPVLR